MTPTDEDMDVVMERLLWDEDDIVIKISGPFSKIFSRREAKCFKTTSIKDVISENEDGSRVKVIILMPFIDADGHQWTNAK